MQRREFTTRMLALLAGAALPGVASAEASDALQVGDHRPVSLIRNGRGVLITSVQLTGGAQAGMTWRGGAAMFDENRLDLSGLTALHGILRTPFRVRYARALPVGEVRLNGAALLVDVQASLLMHLGDVTIGAGDYSWDLPGRLGSAAGASQSGEVIGTARMEPDGRILIWLDATPRL